MWNDSWDTNKFGLAAFSEHQDNLQSRHRKWKTPTKKTAWKVGSTWSSWVISQREKTESTPPPPMQQQQQHWCDDLLPASQSARTQNHIRGFTYVGQRLVPPARGGVSGEQGACGEAVVIQQAGDDHHHHHHHHHNHQDLDKLQLGCGDRDDFGLLISPGDDAGGSLFIIIILIWSMLLMLLLILCISVGA